MITHNPIHDAQDHLSKLDGSLPITNMVCLSCKELFDSGINYDEDLFCSHCVHDNEHITYYENSGLNLDEINEIICLGEYNDIL